MYSPMVNFILVVLDVIFLLTFGQTFGGGFLLLELLGTAVIGVLILQYVAGRKFQPAYFIGLFMKPVRQGSRKPIESLFLGCMFLILPGIITDLLGVFLIGSYFLRGGNVPRSRKPDTIDVEFEVSDDSQGSADDNQP